MNVAAIDIGTNSVRLLITDAQGNELEREMQITRLGEGVDRTGELAETAMARTLSVLEAYGRLLAQHGVTRLRAAATSAARDAKNSQTFFTRATMALGSAPELITGEEEAVLSFQGATFGLPSEDGPFLVIDIGGGSTEFVLGRERPEAAISVDMGCVRMTERHLRSDPPTTSELTACENDVRALLAKVAEQVPVARAAQVIGLAGTITSLAAMHLGLTSYDARKTHGLCLTREDVERLYERLAKANAVERRALLAEPKRAEVIVGGAVVLVTLMRAFAITALRVSERDILDGLAASLRAH